MCRSQNKGGTPRVVVVLLAIAIAAEAYSQEEVEPSIHRTGEASMSRLQLSTGFPEFVSVSAALRASERVYIGAKVQQIVLGRKRTDYSLFEAVFAFGPYISGTGFGPTVSYFFHSAGDSGFIFTNVLFEATAVTPSTYLPQYRDKTAGTFQLLACHDGLRSGTVVVSYGFGTVLVMCKGVTPSLTPAIRLGAHANF